MNARQNEKYAKNLAHRQGAGIFGGPLRIGDLTSQCGEQARFGFHFRAIVCLDCCERQCFRRSFFDGSLIGYHNGVKVAFVAVRRDQVASAR